VRLDQYISELLYEHECVIIPGFGGIVANYRPSFLNPAHHTFSPPSKRLAFNASLRTNDGLLASHLSKRLEVNYSQANSYITTFVSDCTKSLQDGKKLVLDKVGVLYLDTEKNLQFMPDASVNYLKSSFGFASLHSPAIRKDETFAPAVTEEKQGRIIKFSKWKVMEVIPVAAMLAWLIINPSVVNKLNSQLASLNPFTKRTTIHYQPGVSEKENDTNETLKEHSAFVVESVDADTVLAASQTGQMETPVKEEAPVINLRSSVAAQEEVVAVNDKENISEESAIDKTAVVKEAVSNQVTSSKKYHIIGGCFSIEENAVNFVASSQAAGFQPEIIGKNNKGLIMVSLFSTYNSSEADQQLAIIREKNAGGAWMLRK
jgi:hypothetical protein